MFHCKNILYFFLTHRKLQRRFWSLFPNETGETGDSETGTGATGATGETGTGETGTGETRTGETGTGETGSQSQSRSLVPTPGPGPLFPARPGPYGPRSRYFQQLYIRPTAALKNQMQSNIYLTVAIFFVSHSSNFFPFPRQAFNFC